MGRKVIHVGDTTTTGGKVVAGSSHSIDRGRMVARLGDWVTCPACKPRGGPIIEATPNWNIFGINVALEGHRIGCGCKVKPRLVCTTPAASEVD